MKHGNVSGVDVVCSFIYFVCALFLFCFFLLFHSFFTRYFRLFVVLLILSINNSRTIMWKAFCVPSCQSTRWPASLNPSCFHHLKTRVLYPSLPRWPAPHVQRPTGAGVRSQRRTHPGSSDTSTAAAAAKPHAVFRGKVPLHGQITRSAPINRLISLEGEEPLPIPCLVNWMPFFLLPDCFV